MKISAFGLGYVGSVTAACLADDGHIVTGVEGNPAFLEYDSMNHNLFDGFWPDFHLTSASGNALDRGMVALSDSLKTLLDSFEVADFRQGQAYDIGRYEADSAVLTDPASRFKCPGCVAQDTLRLHAPDLPNGITLSITNPLPLLDIGLSSPILASDEGITLTVTDSHLGLMILPALAYTVSVTPTGSGFAATTSAQLFIGGDRFSVGDK